MSKPPHEIPLSTENPKPKILDAVLLLPPKVSLVMSTVAILSLMRLPYKKINGTLVPTVLFLDSPLVFNAFLIALCNAYSGALICMLLRQHYGKLLVFSQRFTNISMAVAMVILFWVAAMAILNII